MALTALKTRAIEIKNEVIAKANTAARLGSLFEDLIDYFIAKIIFSDYDPQSPDPAAEEGRLWYSQSSDSFAYYDAAGLVHAVGRSINLRVKNTQGAGITRGKVVYSDGAANDNINVKLAQANNIANSDKFLAVIISASISNNAIGKAITQGDLSGMDTSSWTVGTELYLSAATAGLLTSTAPLTPNAVVRIGVVSKSHATQGVIQIDIKKQLSLEQVRLRENIFDGPVRFRDGGNLGQLEWIPTAARTLNPPDDSGILATTNNLQDVQDEVDALELVVDDKVDKGEVWNVRTMIENDLLNTSDSYIVADIPGAGAATLSLLPAAFYQAFKLYTVAIKAGNITIAADGAETINGAGSVNDNTAYQQFILFTDGTEWFMRTAILIG